MTQLLRRKSHQQMQLKWLATTLQTEEISHIPVHLIQKLLVPWSAVMSIKDTIHLF